METAALAKPLPRAWITVALLWIVALLNYLDRQMLVNMKASILSDRGLAQTVEAKAGYDKALENLGQKKAAAEQEGRPPPADTPESLWANMSTSQFGLLSSVFLWIYGILSPFAGFIADRFNRRNVIVGSLMVWSVVTWLTGHVHTFPQLVAARALMGISEAFYIPAAVAMIVDYHRGATRSLATGLHISGIYVGSILGGLGGWLATHYGWRFGFNTFGVAGLVYAVGLAFVLQPAPSGGAAADSARPPPVRLGEAFGHLFSWPGFAALLLMNTLVGAAFWTIKNWLPAFFKDEMHISQTYAGVFSTSTFNVAAFFGMLAAGLIADRWSRRNPRARALVPAIAFCAAAPCFFLVGFSGAVPVILVGIMVAGLAQGALDSNLMPALCTIAAPRFRATGYGLLNFAGTMMGGLLTYVGGILKDRNISFATQFQWGAILILVTGLLLFAVRPRKGIEN